MLRQSNSSELHFMILVTCSLSTIPSSRFSSKCSASSASNSLIFWMCSQFYFSSCRHPNRFPPFLPLRCLKAWLKEQQDSRLKDYRRSTMLSQSPTLFQNCQSRTTIDMHSVTRYSFDIALQSFCFSVGNLSFNHGLIDDAKNNSGEILCEMMILMNCEIVNGMFWWSIHCQTHDFSSWWWGR